jgi:hypothetical protein
MKTHDLKTWPDYFEALIERRKTFELRQNDRDFQVGDMLNLQEFHPCSKCGATGRVWDNGDMIDCDCMITSSPKGIYTGSRMLCRVSYILAGCQGIQDSYVILGLEF